MITRRNLLTMVPAASALLTLRSQGAPIPKAALNAGGFAIAVQGWSFKEYTVFEGIEFSAACGAEAIELFPDQRIGGPLGDAKLDFRKKDEQVGPILEHAKKHNVTVVNFGVVGIPGEEAEARKLFEFAKAMKLYGITTESLEVIDMIEKLAKEYDLVVCFHNHPKPSPLWNPDTMWKALQGRDERLGYCADLKHWATSGLNPLEVIKKIAPRVRSFHLADRMSISEHTEDMPLGRGVIDVVGVMDEIRKHGFSGNTSIEYERDWTNSQQQIAQCVGFLRGYAKTRAHG